MPTLFLVPGEASLLRAPQVLWLTTRMLNNQVVQHIEILTKPDEFYFFWHTSFDWVRRSHRPGTSSMLPPPCGGPCLSFLRP